MKKAVSLLLVFVLCLSLCACGGKGKKSKYIGKYINNSYLQTYDSQKIEVTEEMIINKDGTGTIVMKSLSEVYISLGQTRIQNGDILLSYEIEWEESDGYLVVTGSGMQYYKLNHASVTAYNPEGESVEISDSYELKGNKLFEVGMEFAAYTKSN